MYPMGFIDRSAGCLATAARLRRILILHSRPLGMYDVTRVNAPRNHGLSLATLISDVLLGNMTYDKFAENRIEDKHRVSVTDGLGGGRALWV